MQQQGMTQHLSEQEVLTDLLQTEKHITSSYNTFVTETTCANLRQNLRDILNEEQSIHETLWNTMSQKGWYPVSDAQPQEVQKVKDQYNQLPV